MVLFQLPQDLAQCILNDWLNDVKSISALDVACSTDELREEFLHLIRHPQFFLSEMETVERCADFVKWLSMRKVKTATLVVDALRLVDIAAITFLRLPSVTTLKLKHLDDDDDNVATDSEHLAYLLRRCPALTCFDDDYWSNPDIDDVEILALLLVPNIPLRSLLLSNCQYLQESTIRSIVFCFRHTLRELDVRSVVVSDAILDFIALACPNLDTLCVNGQELHPAAILHYCADVCAKLKHFELYEYGENAAPHAPSNDQQDSFVFQLIDCLPLVETLYVGVAYTTWRSLQYVLDHCPNIVRASFALISITISISSNNDKTCRVAYDMEPACDVFPFMTQLPFKVTKLDLKDCENITEDLVAPFLAKHGPDIKILDVEVVTSGDVFDDSTDGRIVLLNGCINAQIVRLVGWLGLNQEVTAKLFPNHHLHLTTLDIIRSPLLNDTAVSILLGRCPALKSLTIEGSPLVTDSTLEIIARNCGTLHIWSLHGTSISARGLIKLAVQLPLCPFDSISVEHRHFAPELKENLMSMGEVGRIWTKQLKVP